MKRDQFLKYLALLPVAGYAMKTTVLDRLKDTTPSETKMPVLFLGHGSPMNAIEENEFVQGFRTIGENLETPRAVLCVSAHWETAGTFVTAMESPRTIHDFGGFPPELFAVEYPAPGSPEIAKETQSLVTSTTVGLDDHWGLDHGAWSVIKHIYPKADVPVVQLSLNYNMTPQQHYDLAKELADLRSKGILIVGSGNVVHNLRRVAWDKLNEPYAYEWATEANEKIKQWVQDKDHTSLINFRNQGSAFDLAIPTAEHYLPLLYALALQEENEEVTVFNDKPLAGSLTMTSFKIG